MSRRIHPSWIVVASIETAGGDRCVDLFLRPDGTYSFEAFRRDPEDAGAWTPMAYFSAAAFASRAEAEAAARRAIPWFAAGH